MPDFVSLMTDEAREKWKALLKDLKLAYGTDQMITVNTKMETAEDEIPRLMTLKPGEDKSGTD